MPAGLFAYVMVKSGAGYFSSNLMTFSYGYCGNCIRVNAVQGAANMGSKRLTRPCSAEQFVIDTADHAVGHMTGQNRTG